MPAIRGFLKRHMRMLMNIWPPFLGAGIRVTRLSADWREIDVAMNLHRWNSNYVGTHYGGSLYSMTDPFLMLMLIENLGPAYVVWDKSAMIRFRRPGKGRVSTRFRITQEELDEIRQSVQADSKIDRCFKVLVNDEDGMVVAEVEKRLHIRRKTAASKVSGETPA